MYTNAILEKSLNFAVRIVKLRQHLVSTKKEYSLSGQIQRAGTSIGANVAEAQRAQSTPDFAAKMGIAIKEAGETEYWLKVLHATGYLTDVQFDSLYADLAEILRLLTAICRKVNALH